MQHKWLVLVFALALLVPGHEADAQTKHIIVKVTGINVSFMPDAVQMNVDNLPSVCSPLMTLTFRSSNPETVKAVYSAALAAMAGNYYAVMDVNTTGPNLCDTTGLAICNPANQSGCYEQ